MRKIISGAVIAAIIAAGAAPFLWVKQDAAIPGMRLNGKSVGGMGREELVSLIKDKNQKLKTGKLLLTHGEIREEWTLESLGARYDESKIEDVLSVGRSGNLLSDWLVRWKTLLSGSTERSLLVYDAGAVKEKIGELSDKYGKSVQEPMPVFNHDGSVTFSAGIPYLKIDEDKLMKVVGDSLADADFPKVELPVTEEKKPNITSEEAAKFNTVLAKYTTYFGYNPNRSRNIEISAGSISGTVVQPGERFSYNDTTGARSPDNGYLEAPVIINGKLEPDYGGGVCQVSTTLFNAVMLAGLEVTDRVSHFSPAVYVPIGQDATVAYDYIDFRFKNQLKNPVYIYTFYVPGEITCYIIGAREDKPEIAHVLLQHSDPIEFKTVEKVDPEQKEEKTTEYGHEGYSASILQYAKWEDGRIYQDTFESYYDPVDTVITYKTDPKKKKELEKKENKKNDSETEKVTEKKTKGGEGNKEGKIIPLT